MTMGRSTWYRDDKGSIARLDTAGEVWTAGTDLAEALPALTCLGVHDILTRGTASPPLAGEIRAGVYQTGPDEIVLAVTVNSFTGVGSTQAQQTRPVRLDLASGAVIEMPAPFFPAAGTGTYTVDEGWRRYQISDGQHWSVITGQEITQHQWTDPVFTQPDGSLTGMSDRELSTGLSNGQLYLCPRESPWHYRIFDLDNLLTDGQVYGGSFLPPPVGWEQLWTIRTDPDRWLAGRPAGEIGRDFLDALLTAAQRIGSSADVLLTVLNLESGLRTGAYHPAGRYGLLQLTAEELTAAGWTGTPEDYLSAGQGQLVPIAVHLAGLGIPAGADEVGLWACLHLSPPERAGLDSGTVLAAPTGPHPELYARYGVADVARDDQLTVDDMYRYLRSKRNDARLTQLRDRASHLGATIPDWKTLAEVTDGEASAASLGLTTIIVPVPVQPGSSPGQVVSIDPPAASLTPRADPVQVRVSTAS
jgi:hypothetical protein